MVTGMFWIHEKLETERRSIIFVVERTIRCIEAPGHELLLMCK